MADLVNLFKQPHPPFQPQLCLSHPHLNTYLVFVCLPSHASCLRGRRLVQSSWTLAQGPAVGYVSAE